MSTTEDATIQVDVHDLNIGLVSSSSGKAAAPKRSKRGQARADGVEILNGAHLRIKSGGRYALIGPNGSGKSTGIRISSMLQIDENAPSDSKATVLRYVLDSDTRRNKLQSELNVISTALDQGDELVVSRALRTIRLDRRQNELFEADKIARLRSGARGYDARKVLRTQEAAVEAASKDLEAVSMEDAPDAVEKQALQMQMDLQAQIDALPAINAEKTANTILRALGFTEETMKKSVNALSGGWRMRCLLATALVQTTDLLILDEPTNFLDMFGILWLQKHLDDLQDSCPNTAVVVVSHDRDFVNTTSEELILLKDKQLSYFPGNLDSYDKSIQHETLRLTRMKEAQEKQVAHMTKTVSDSIRQGKKTGDDNKLRQAKSRQKKLDERMGMEVNAKGGRFKLNRDLPGYHTTMRDDIAIPKAEASVTLHFPPAPEMRFQSFLISLEGVSFRYRQASILQAVSLVIHPGDRIGIVGLNGTGKSTLVQLLTGNLNPASGTITRYPRLKVGFYSQHAVDDLASKGTAHPSLTALSLLSSSTIDLSLEMTEQDLRKLLASTGLVGRTVSDTPVQKLSGGQLVRLALAILFLDPPHVFILDEPSTHLDLATVDALTKALDEFTGAVVLVSHDRYMVRRVIEGEAPATEEDEKASLGSGDEDDRRRFVYEIRAGKLKLLNDGIAGWEATVEKKLVKQGLL